jgi:hypothetical protein
MRGCVDVEASARAEVIRIVLSLNFNSSWPVVSNCNKLGAGFGLAANWDLCLDRG